MGDQSGKRSPLPSDKKWLDLASAVIEEIDAVKYQGTLATLARTLPRYEIDRLHEPGEIVRMPRGEIAMVALVKG